jgi:uncharacterized protein
LAGPIFDRAEDVQQIVGLIMRHYNTIARGLHRGGSGDGFCPIFDVDPRHNEVTWQLWIDGFAQAMALRPESWSMMVEDDNETAQAELSALAALTASGRGG